jgi:uncharacterized protein (DUF2062 family)
MLRTSFNSLERNAAGWLRQGISPRRLALTLALGFAIGCIPVVGIPTILCAALAQAMRLNQPAIQAANYAAMPLQLFLIVPFVRMGEWFFADSQKTIANTAQIHLAPISLVAHLGSTTGEALFAWSLFAIPTVALMTLTLTGMLRRIPALAHAENGD